MSLIQKLPWIRKAGNVRAADSTNVGAVDAPDSNSLLTMKLVSFGQLQAACIQFWSSRFLDAQVSGRYWLRTFDQVSKRESTSSQPKKGTTPLDRRCPEMPLRPNVCNQCLNSPARRLLWQLPFFVRRMGALLQDSSFSRSSSIVQLRACASASTLRACAWDMSFFLCSYCCMERSVTPEALASPA